MLGGPNLFFKGLQETWRHHLRSIWKERKVPIGTAPSPNRLIRVPDNAQYYAALGCVAVALSESVSYGVYQASKQLALVIEEGHYEEKKNRAEADYATATIIGGRSRRLMKMGRHRSRECHGDSGGSHARSGRRPGTRCSRLRFRIHNRKGGLPLAREGASIFLLRAEQGQSHRRCAKALFRQIRAVVNDSDILGLALTGYGKDLLKGILGADCPVVETIAHATAGLHFFPDADCICDVGGVDVKIMILNNGAVTDFRLNSQCSSGNGAFLQGVAERFGIPLDIRTYQQAQKDLAELETLLGTDSTPQVEYGMWTNGVDFSSFRRRRK